MSSFGVFTGNQLPTGDYSINLHRAAVRLKISGDNPGDCGATWVQNDCVITSAACIPTGTKAADIV